MKAGKLPSVKFLRECFEYEEATGKLFWRRRPKKHFFNRGYFITWNKKYAGKEAFREEIRGYRKGTVSGVTCYTHRVVWKLITGKEPSAILDHKDRNKNNNRIENLRAATLAQNCINTTKTKGVCFDVSRNKWMAYTKVDQKMITIGRYVTEAEAKAARVAKIRELHGEFAP